MSQIGINGISHESEKAIMFHQATRRYFLRECSAMCAWQGCPSLHFNTKHLVLGLITRQAKADRPLHPTPTPPPPLWVTAIDNRFCLATICQRQSINHFQCKHCRKRSITRGWSFVTTFIKLSQNSLLQKVLEGKETSSSLADGRDPLVLVLCFRCLVVTVHSGWRPRRAGYPGSSVCEGIM